MRFTFRFLTSDLFPRELKKQQTEQELQQQKYLRQDDDACLASALHFTCDLFLRLCPEREKDLDVVTDWTEGPDQHLWPRLLIRRRSVSTRSQSAREYERKCRTQGA